MRAEAQPASEAETTVKTSSSIEAVPVTAPGRSYPRPSRLSRGLFGISFRPAISAISATGAGSSIVQRQPASVRKPESTRPMEKPVAPQLE